jgi:hypothetical protein
MLHRMRLTYESLADGVTGASVLREILGPFGAPARNGQAVHA